MQTTEPKKYPDSKIPGAYMGLPRGQQAPDGPHINPLNLGIGAKCTTKLYLQVINITLRKISFSFFVNHNHIQSKLQ